MKTTKRTRMIERTVDPSDVPFKLRDRDLDCLKFIWRDRVWESSDFAQHFGAYYYCHRRPQLWRAGYIEREFPAQRLLRSLVKPGSIELMHLLTNKGERALYDAGRIHRYFRTYDATNKSSVSIKHDLQVKRLVQAWRHATTQRNDVRLVEDEQTLHAPNVSKQHGRRFYEKEERDDKGDDYIISDKTISFEFLKGTRREGRSRRKVEMWKDRLCPIEWHTGSETLTRKDTSELERLERKFRIYFSAARTLRFQKQFASNNLTVLTIVEGGDDHLENVTELARHVTGGRAPNQFLAIQAPRLFANPLGALWVNANGESVSLLR